MNLPNRDELLLRDVLAFPKDSVMGLADVIVFSKSPAPDDTPSLWAILPEVAAR
jgi:hypothetical protein